MKRFTIFIYSYNCIYILGILLIFLNYKLVPECEDLFIVDIFCEIASFTM